MVSIEKLVRERILILDGAMGTMIQRYNLTEEDFRGERFAGIPGQMKGNNDLLCLTRPDVIQDIHRKYLMAGADIIETNTFSSTSVSMADYHVQEYVREMNLAAVKLAREVADEFSTLDKPRFVAGSIGPTNKTCSMSPDVNNPAMRALTYDELAITRSISRAPYSGIKPRWSSHSCASWLNTISTWREDSLLPSSPSFLSRISDAIGRSMSWKTTVAERRLMNSGLKVFLTCFSMASPAVT